jgi:hypothetical protein
MDAGLAFATAAAVGTRGGSSRSNVSPCSGDRVLWRLAPPPRRRRQHLSTLAPRGCASSEDTGGATAPQGEPWPLSAGVPAYVRARMSGSHADEARAEALAALRGARAALLLLAARAGDEPTVRALAAGGGGGGQEDAADVNVADAEGSTPTMRAASRGHVRVVAALLETGRVDLAQKNNWGYDAVIYSGSVRTSLPDAHAELLRMFAQYGADPARAQLRWTQRPSLDPSEWRPGL